MRYAERVLAFAPHEFMNPGWSTSWGMESCTSSPQEVDICEDGVSGDEVQDPVPHDVDHPLSLNLGGAHTITRKA